MAYTIELYRSPDGTNWTLMTTWTTNGGPFADWVADTPGAGTFSYEVRVTSNDSTDVVGPRRIAAIAGNR